jgi:hypothetical protein
MTFPITLWKKHDAAYTMPIADDNFHNTEQDIISSLKGKSPVEMFELFLDESFNTLSTNR